MHRLVTLLKDTAKEFIDEDPFTIAGALSYYTLLSMAPLLLMIVSIAGLVYGEEAARGQVLATFESAVGTQAAGLAQDVLANAYERGSSFFSAVVAVIGLLVGGTTAFAQLQGALDKIWGVKAPPRPWLAVLRGRLLSFLFVGLLGVIAVASLVASSIISALSEVANGAAFDWMWRLADIAVPLVLMTGLFAVLFKWLPDATIRWREVWIGAAITSLLFAIGRVAIGIYIGRSGVASAYGAAGSVIVLMVWIYYSSIIILFGAEITQVYARQSGAAIVGKFSEADAPASEGPASKEATAKGHAQVSQVAHA
jgi:membrane protein